MKKYNFIFSASLTISLVIFQGCEYQDPNPDGCDLGHRTQTQEEWGGSSNGKNTAYLRDTHFEEVFPGGLRLGCGGGFNILFSSANAIDEFLPNLGEPAPINQNYVNPTSVELKNRLAGQLTALTLNMHYDNYFDDFGRSDEVLPNLVVCSGKFQGMTVELVLNQANRVLGNCSSQFSLEEALELVDNINKNFQFGLFNNGFLCCPSTELETVPTD